MSRLSQSPQENTQLLTQDNIRKAALFQRSRTFPWILCRAKYAVTAFGVLAHFLVGRRAALRRCGPARYAALLEPAAPQRGGAPGYPAARPDSARKLALRAATPDRADRRFSGRRHRSEVGNLSPAEWQKLGWPRLGRAFLLERSGCPLPLGGSRWSRIGRVMDSLMTHEALCGLPCPAARSTGSRAARRVTGGHRAAPSPGRGAGSGATQ